MSNPTQQEFRLENIDKTYGKVNDETMTLVTIRQATPEENRLREAFLSKQRDKYEEYITFLKEGYKYFPYRDEYEITVMDYDYVDEMRNRFKWLKDRIVDAVFLQEIYLTLAATNIQQGGKPYIKFINGHIAGILPSLPRDVRDEIHEKVLEMNPSWSGEVERMCNTLSAIIPSLQNSGNFKDLNLKSAFSKSKPYLGNLMEEINSDVFDHKASIKINVSTEVLGGEKREFMWALKQTNPPLENIILYYSPIPGRDRHSYIGVLEHGKFEIRVVARRDKFNYWDTNIEGIVETLRQAIEWWQKKSTYRQSELEDIAEAAAYKDALEDGKAFWSEMEDYGYNEDDF